MPRRVRKIDFKAWDQLTGLNTQAAVDGIVNVQALSFLIPATILRMRGAGGLVMFDESCQAGDKAIFGYGIAVVSTDSFNVGVTAMPDPIAELEFPWLYLTQVDLECTVVVGDQALGSTTFRLPEIDSRSMRKIKPNESLVMIEELQGLAGAPVVLMRIPPLRILIGT